MSECSCASHMMYKHFRRSFYSWKKTQSLRKRHLPSRPKPQVKRWGFLRVWRGSVCWCVGGVCGCQILSPSPPIVQLPHSVYCPGSHSRRARQLTPPKSGKTYLPNCTRPSGPSPSTICTFNWSVRGGGTQGLVRPSRN